MSSDKPHVIIYTDGACYGNPGPGGWAAILHYGRQEKVLRGAASHTTNNRMELRAAIAALEALMEPCLVDLHTDSQYLRKGITEWLPRWRRNGWRTTAKKPVKNQDLWRLLVSAEQPHEVRWHWVKGHAGDRYNERVDKLARTAIDEMARTSPRDLEPAGKPFVSRLTGS